MNILAIETSCDETAVALVEAEGDERSVRFTILGNALVSQIEKHRAYGGVFPALAKREHAKNLVPILEATLEEAEMLHEDMQAIPADVRSRITDILARETGLSEALLAFLADTEPPEIDAIAVTSGPGLEPALWVGVNFAKALAIAWDKPLVAVNHMEGHILAALTRGEDDVLAVNDARMPVLALLISGGHTELVVMKEWLTYEILGRTLDDAVGEAFDKVARMLGLPYPGGPEISRLAESLRQQTHVGFVNPYVLPRPMIDSNSCDFSFAGLKTAVLYLLKKVHNTTRPDKIVDLPDELKKQVAHEFENAVSDVLWKKTALALDQTNAKTLVVGGGVSANAHIRRVFEEKIKEYPETALRIPAAALTTDNAVMIAIAGFYRASQNDFANITALRAHGNLPLA